MTRRILVALAASAALFLPAGPAWGDPVTYHGGYEDDCRNGGCGEREESYENTGCKYVCPSFERSPVHDAFNFSPFICMPGATCYEDGDRRQERPGQQPASAELPPPGCLISVPFHCDPKPS